MYECQYCGETVGQDGPCRGCGARRPKPKKKDDIVRTAPFFWDGYVVWSEVNHLSDSAVCHFWRGADYVGSVRVCRSAILGEVGEYGDVMPAIWTAFVRQQERDERPVPIKGPDMKEYFVSLTPA